MKTFFCSIFILFVCAGNAGLHAQAPDSVLYGFTGFPHDFTATAEDEVHSIINPNSTIYAIHMDTCLPWKQALYNQPFPSWITRGWNSIKARIPEGRPLYIAMTPTSFDRYTLANPCGSTEDTPGAMPALLAGAKFNNLYVMRAYTNYVRRVIQAFNPSYVNIGIEISEMALEHAEEWPAYEALFHHVRAQLRTYHPAVKVGIELVLQSLMHPPIGALVKSTVEASDYIGISFYPYSSEYGVALGVPPLPAGDQQWLGPLNWLRTYTTKPIAICETGYTTKDIVIPAGPINLGFYGDEAKQEAYLRDLITIAKRDRYLFAIWFVPVDYEKLLVTRSDIAAEWWRIWVNTGLFNSELQPKPAWSQWQSWKLP